MVVEVVCVDGLAVAGCARSVEASLRDLDVLDLLESIWRDDPEKPVLLVASSFSGVGDLLEGLTLSGRNPFLVEVTGLPEATLTGLPLEALVDYWVGLVVTGLGDRVSARRVHQRVPRRMALRRLFLIPPSFVVVPRVSGGCDKSVCPFDALGERGVDESSCRGCMVCWWQCDSVAEPRWTGVAGLVYAYEFLSKHGLDGIVFVCRQRLELLERVAAEASPARLLPFHVPCISWLSPYQLDALREQGVYVHLLAGGDVCGDCALREAAERVLKTTSVPRGGGLSAASSAAFTGYMRRQRGIDEVAELLSRRRRGVS